MTNTPASIPAPLWNGPRFEVPIAPEALMIGKPNRYKDDNGNVIWADLAVNYQAVRQGGNGQPTPFARQTEAPGLGVHLHWTLPKSLRHGHQQANSDVDFPLVPDRWVILRAFTDENNQTVQHTAWILESSFIGSQSNGGTNAYPSDASDSALTYLGKRFDFSDWAEGSSSSTPLRAIAPGDMGYAAVYDNVVNVFAFYDDMKGMANGSYSYSIIGWYADGQNDVLYNMGVGNERKPWTTQEEWQALMASLNWKTHNLSQAQTDWQSWKQNHNITGTTPIHEQMLLPAQSLYHGMIYNIDWQGVEKSYDTGVPGKDTQLGLAIGNTPTEGIAAWLADKLNNPEAERLLTAFDLDYVYDFNSNQVRFEEKAHSAEFVGSDAGKLWRVLAQRGKKSKSGDLSVPLDQANTDKLTELNRIQSQYNAVYLRNQSSQAELFACGWKKPRVSPFDAALLKQVNDAIAALKATIEGNKSQLHSLSTQIDQIKQTFDTDTVFNSEFILEQTEAPRFYKANNPVLMVANAKSNNKWSDAGSEDEGKTLVGRFTGQNMTELTVTATLNNNEKTVVFNQALITQHVSFPESNLLPKELPDLWLESLLLNSDNATLLAQWFFIAIDVTPSNSQLSALSEQIKDQQSAIWNASAHAAIDKVAATTLARFNGLLPEKISMQEWVPPWSPLYFDWEVQWYPSSTSTADTLKNWTLTEIDYQWPEGQAIDLSNSCRFSGRTLMNAQVTKGLSSKLQNFVDNSSEVDQLPISDKVALNNMIEKLKDSDVLTQSLDGFINQLILHDATIINPLTDQSIEQMSEGEQHWLPTVKSTTNDLPFFPLRGGHFVLKRFWVIDSYGRYFSNGDSSIVLPIRSESMITPGGDSNQRFIQLPPRTNQPARLNLRFIDANNDTIESNSSDLTSPICGWVLSNHLDEALMVYDAKGDLLGQVQAITRDQGTGLRWDPVPGVNYPYGAAPDIKNEHLNGFITGLLNKGVNDSEVLSQLLSVIDATLWQTDSLGKQQDSNLSVLVGHPLAVVRGKVGLSLQGDPVYNQNWSKTGDKDDDNVTAVTFPTRIGDSGIKRNGVMGYFVDNQYEQFNAVYGYNPSHHQTRMNLLGLEAQNSAASDSYITLDPLLHLPADNSTDNPTHKWLTLLVDPRGDIPAACGAAPLKEIFLAPGPVAQAMTNIEMTFRAGPILVDPENINMPLPGQIEGKWSWIHRTGVTMWQEQSDISTQKESASFSDEPPVLQEGWLKLSAALTKA